MSRKRLAALVLGLSLAAAQAATPIVALAGPEDPVPTRSKSSPTTKKPAPGTVVFSTSQSRFDPGVDNQGWWAVGTPIENVDANDNYIVGRIDAEYRNFFTFDVSGLGKHVVSATLRVNTSQVVGFSGSETLRLSDVSTDAAMLNDNDGQDANIFRDLGTGRVYGEYPVGSVGSDEVLSLELNKDALRDLKHAAKRAPGGYFSIGGSLLNVQHPYVYVFGASDLPVELVVRTR